MKTSQRFWQIDFWRGITVLLMVFFNWSFTLFFLNIYKLDLGFLYWRVFPQFIGGSFIFLAGLSVVLSRKRYPMADNKKYFLRGLKILLLGLGITLLTWLSFPSYTIVFGILHMIGFSVLVSPLFFKLGESKLLLSVIILIFGFTFQSFFVNSAFLFPIGLVNQSFQTFDYWPVLPWLGVFLLGMYFGEKLFENKKHSENKNFISKVFCLLGRNSLKIYLVHQPVLILVLLGLGFPIF